MLASNRSLAPAGPEPDRYPGHDADEDQTEQAQGHIADDRGEDRDRQRRPSVSSTGRSEVAAQANEDLQRDNRNDSEHDARPSIPGEAGDSGDQDERESQNPVHQEAPPAFHATH